MEEETYMHCVSNHMDLNIQPRCVQCKGCMKGNVLEMFLVGCDKLDQNVMS
jgi:hypothetical protein